MKRVLVAALFASACGTPAERQAEPSGSATVARFEAAVPVPDAVVAREPDFVLPFAVPSIDDGPNGVDLRTLSSGAMVSVMQSEIVVDGKALVRLDAGKVAATEISNGGIPRLETFVRATQATTAHVAAHTTTPFGTLHAVTATLERAGVRNASLVVTDHGLYRAIPLGTGPADTALDMTLTVTPGAITWWSQAAGRGKPIGVFRDAVELGKAYSLAVNAGSAAALPVDAPLIVEAPDPVPVRAIVDAAIAVRRVRPELFLVRGAP